MQTVNQRFVFIRNVEKMNSHSMFLDDPVKGRGNPLRPHDDAAHMDHLIIGQGQLDLKSCIRWENSGRFEKNTG